MLCVEGQFACRLFGCVDSAQVCDGRQDCLDGSDEDHCGTHQHPVRGQGPWKYIDMQLELRFCRCCEVEKLVLMILV